MSVKIVEKDGKRYINEEEILLEYKCINKLQILFFRLPIFLLMIYLFFRINKQLDTYTLVWYLSFILIFGALWSIKRDIQNFYYVGFYLTNNNFITFSGRVIPLKEIYFSLGVGSMGWGASS
ncbi:hypothetical protein KO488_10410 [Poseidonibacter lekithochrous]|uniref:hypothetical protein n=1 Tax=Poseidonibacter TaxID=2321187 RepID=UPI001C082BC9|nr:MULTISPECIES: hypothetical protein [Poseidonibacter]MBU3015171.1 hypothetical protein [Poseidonibacter lekithochrous]MDO6828468.1 hypothetical protein [Poseidonibacter sp. 1_MG-2023]